MSSHRARIRGSIASLDSHFEKSLNELNSQKRGTTGRSAYIRPVIEEEENTDFLRETFILRKASLTQEQWEKYLSQDSSPAPKTEDVSRSGESSVLLGRRSGISLGRSSGAATGDAPVMSRKGNMFDLESSQIKVSQRSSLSIIGFPLMSPWNKFVMIWTQVVLALDLTYTAFLVPLLVGFEVSDVDWGWGCIIDFIAERGQCFESVDFISGALFTVEFFVNFHVGFIGKNNTQRKLVMDGKAVAWYYITHGHFFVDLLTILVWIAQVVFIIVYYSGSSNLNHSSATKVYQAVRVLRLVRFTSLLRRLYATAAVAQQTVLPGLHVSHAAANFFNLVFGGLVLANFLACLWNFTAIAENYNNTWINFYSVLLREYGSQDSITNGMLTSDEARGIPGPRRYLVALYFTLVTIGTVGYGDIYPQSATEEFIGMFIICVGLVFFGIILGSIAEALQRLSQDAKQAVLFRGRMESVDKWMGQRRLHMKLRNKIANFYAEDWLYGADAIEEVQVMTELPQGLRKEIALAVNLPLFKKLNFFNNFPESCTAAIASHMSPLQLPAGFELCEEEDLASCFWILHEGEVAASSYSHPNSDTILKAPALVGHVALLQEQDPRYFQRQCMYRTNTSCLLWEVPLREVLALLRQSPNLYQMASQQALPNHYFDYLAINPAASFLAEEEKRLNAAGGNFNVGGGNNSAQFKELGENTINSLNSAGSNLAQKSAPSLASRGSQNITKADLKRAELKSMKSMRG